MLLCEFPSVTQPEVSDFPVRHTVTHHIRTTGPPVSCRLAPEKLQAARHEFQHMLHATGYPSAPPRAAGLPHSTWSQKRPQVTGVPVAIIVPYHPRSLLGSASLHGAMVVCTYEIPVEPDDVPKTAITTLSLTACPSASRTRPKLSRGLWTKFCTASITVSTMWMLFLPRGVPSTYSSRAGAS